MNAYNIYSNMGADHLSVEVNSDGLFSDVCRSNATIEPNLNSLFESDLFADELNTADLCQSSNLLESMDSIDELNAFDKYLGLSLTENNLSLDDISSTYVVDHNETRKFKKQPIPLSQSVGIGAPQNLVTSSRRIEIVHPLEETFRLRYKSDYFSQNGSTRKPRYVADRMGNHYITLKVPAGITGKIRIDWITVPTEDGTRYVMPYRFQKNNDLADASDCNPMFIDIEADALGTMKIYLVLIKAKQDALKTLQPLKPYHPLKDIFGIVDKPTAEKMPKLTPKQLIRKFQLCKSQLAFTLCTLNANGQSYATEWTSTVLSTVIEEASGDPPLVRTVSCPNCACSISVADGDPSDQEMNKKNKRKSEPRKIEKPRSMKKQKTFPEKMHTFD